jgi:hypothetical protein
MIDREFSPETAANGTTTLLVLEGEVEFSDANSTKTILAGQHQTSVIKPNGSPFDPVTVDEGKIEKL